MNPAAIPGASGASARGVHVVPALDPATSQPIPFGYFLTVGADPPHQVDINADAIRIGARVPIELTHIRFRDAHWTQLKAAAEFYGRHLQTLARAHAAPPAPEPEAAGAEPYWLR